MSRDISDPLVVELQKRPQIYLTVSNHNRLAINTQQLSWSQIHSLRFCALNRGSTTSGKPLVALPELREIILENPNLRKLDIEFEHSVQMLRLQLPLLPSDRLPPLQELSFSGAPVSYEFDPRHCSLLKRCMDWSHLRRLNLGINCPPEFFQAIGPSLHNLQSLVMAIRVGGLQNRPMTCVSHDAVIQFLASLPKLVEIQIQDYSGSSSLVVPVILETHQSLQRLSYHSSGFRNRSIPWEAYVWTMAHIQGLRDACPGLLELELDVPLTNGKWVRQLLF